MTESIIVTGATGFIGRHCLKFLLAEGFHVHALYSASSPLAGEEMHGQIDWHRVDLLDRQATGSLLNKISATKLLHLAWYAEPGKFWDSPLNRQWLESSLALLKIFAACGGKRFIGAGSCAEYNWKDGRLSENKTALAAATLYGSCKARLFETAADYCRSNNLEFAWGRIFWLYGPHEDRRRLVAYVINALLAGEKARCSSGTQERDFLYVDDVARAFSLLCRSGIEGALNIGSGKAVSVGELVKTIGALLGKESLLEMGAAGSAAGEPPLVVADTSRLENELHFIPDVSLEDGLLQSIQWWRKQNGLN